MNTDCPSCGSDKFFEGPHGGESVNVKCARCGAYWNFMGPFGFQAITSDDGFYEAPARPLADFVRVLAKQQTGDNDV